MDRYREVKGAHPKAAVKGIVDGEDAITRAIGAGLFYDARSRMVDSFTKCRDEIREQVAEEAQRLLREARAKEEADRKAKEEREKAQLAKEKKNELKKLADVARGHFQDRRAEKNEEESFAYAVRRTILQAKMTSSDELVCFYSLS